MTSKERELLEDNLSPECIDEWGGTITKLMRLHTLHIAEQAVEEETKNWGDPNNEMFVKRIGSNTLSRIKTLTE